MRHCKAKTDVFLSNNERIVKIHTNCRLFELGLKAIKLYSSQTIAGIIFAVRILLSIEC